MNWSELLLGQLPEAIYFPLFLIFAKNIRTKKILFTLTLIVEYFIIVNIFKYNIWFQATYTFMTFAILKYFYKEKAQVTDIFTLGIGSLLLMIITGISYFLVYLFIHSLIVVAIVSRLLIFTLLFIINYRFYKIQNLYKKMWNRNDKIKKKMKSITFRCWNLVLFNFMFYILSIFINLISN